MSSPAKPERPRTDHGQDERHPDGWRVNPSPDGRGSPPRRRIAPWLTWLLFAAVLVFNVWLVSQFDETAKRVRVPYSPYFVEQVRAGNVTSIASKGSTLEGEFRRAMRYPPDDRSVEPTVHFKTEVPTFADADKLSALLDEHGVVVNAEPADQGRPIGETLLLSILPALLIIGLLVFMMRRAAGGAAGGLSGFGRARPRRVEASTQRLRFDDVAGIDDVKEELTEIVDFLRDPDKYKRLGGRIPRGVLLTGPPGTGKTLLARALAGEAGVPFFSISASEFVEMYVGVGASRVRDLFAQAKEAAPAIVFIDELDAIGRTRGPAGGMSGGHDEREQTLNQILTEMDGFDPSIGVIVLSATNRPEIIDRALLRPGRFDRRLAVQPPDTRGRREILDVHTRSVPLADDVDLDRLAASTTGMVGADLANVVNEAALLAARHGQDSVTMANLHEALEKLILGTERRILLSSADRERTAYHEAGHALVAMLVPDGDPVRKVSIIPRGQALGVTLSAPEADRFSYDERYLQGKLRMLLGGRGAERLIFGTVTSGAEEDIREATELVRRMVGAWGMSEAIGPMTVVVDHEHASLPWGAEASIDTQRLVDEEMRRMIEVAESDVRRMLVDNRPRLDGLVEALLAQESLDEPDAYAAAGLPMPEAVQAATEPRRPQAPKVP